MEPTEHERPVPEIRRLVVKVGTSSLVDASGNKFVVYGSGQIRD